MKLSQDLRGILGLGLSGLVIIALGLHSWGLGWFNSLVFDEIYYVPFALNYLQGEPVFDAHPPLGKYLIALGIALGQFPAEWLQWPTIPLGDRLVSPISYRWLNAVAGATLPGLTLLLGFYLSAIHSLQRRLAFAMLAGGMVLLIGLPLVESRLALINIYWVWFGVCGQLCWVLAKTGDAESEVKTPELKSVSLTVKRPLVPISWGYANRLWHQSRLSQDSSPARLRSQTVWWRVAAGVSLGAAINVKWNGAGFWLGILLLELAGWQPVPKHRQSVPWQALLLYLGIVPLVTYSLLWIPHLRLNQVSFLEIHHQLWTLHQSIGGDGAAHPYCSAWYSWPFMVRPVSYLYQQVVGSRPDAILAPLGSRAPVTYTLQGMGNPLLWWFATAAVVALTAGWVSRSWGRLRPSRAKGRNTQPALKLDLESPAQPARVEVLENQDPNRDNVARPVVSFVLVNYAANWLPWLLVSRCTFLYHALGMMVFAVLGLAWLLARWLCDHRWHYRVAAWVIILLVLWGFAFWLPVLIGLPLSPEALKQRWWLKSWI